MSEERQRSGRRRRREAGSAREVDYRRLRNPFEPQRVFSADEVEAMHQTALRVLEELGVRVLLPEARRRYAAAGALVDEDSQMVRIGRDIVEAALASAPRSFRARAPSSERDLLFEIGALIFKPGSGCPHASDRERGRRPGSLADFEETLKLAQSFDVLHSLGPMVEPQDVPPPVRHYAVTRAQLTLSDKLTFAYSRGAAQVEDSFEMIRLAHGLSADDFAADVWCHTVINTNSPRQLDNPMAQGIIDFAEAGQLAIITPFCLAGAMAPITVAGALTLQHAEAMAGITLSQLSRPGAPVCNGGFSSNVDMKSGSPAFGTPEHVKLTLGAGQLARRLGLPWRSAAGAAANVSDAQGAHETLMSQWSTLLAGATLVVHAAGWLEGGLTFGYEKLINDIEALQCFAELCVNTPGDADSIGFDAIAEVQPGGHFFAAEHTMARYQTAFYEPLVADLSNFGSWTEAGSKTATERATAVWKRALAEYQPLPGAEEIADRLAPFIEKRMAEGGAPPMA